MKPGWTRLFSLLYWQYAMTRVEVAHVGGQKKKHCSILLCSHSIQTLFTYMLLSTVACFLACSSTVKHTKTERQTHLLAIKKEVILLKTVWKNLHVGSKFCVKNGNQASFLQSRHVSMSVGKWQYVTKDKCLKMCLNFRDVSLYNPCLCLCTR